jgi:hypothetical protein
VPAVPGYTRTTLLGDSLVAAVLSTCRPIVTINDIAMAGPLSNNIPHFVAPPYLQAFRPGSSMSSSRFDEGYSEDTKSQTGSDMVMRTDSRMGDGAMEQDAQYPLPDWVLNMSETERSGTIPIHGRLPTLTNKAQSLPMLSFDRYALRL